MPKPFNLKSKETRKRLYQIAIEAATIFVLIAISSLFYAFQKYEPVKIPPLTEINDTLIAVIIPPTEQHLKPPKPPTPIIKDFAGIEIVDDEKPVDLPLDEPYLTEEIDFGGAEPESFQEEVFQSYQVQHKPEIQKQIKPIYPSLAKRAGLEASVVVRVLIGKTGKVEKAEIYASTNRLFDEIALEAAKQFEFTPGIQNFHFVKVWMNIPFRFRLK